MKKTYESIDLTKFIGSILILTMHCNALSDYDAVSMIPSFLSRWGVPFFFICSAYFLFSKSGQTDFKKTLSGYIRRIGMLYLAWLIFNLPNVIYLRLYPKNLTSVRTWLYFLKNSVLSSTFTGSWYLASSIFSAWFICVLCRKFPTKVVLWITSALYILCVLTSAYAGLLPAHLLKVLTFLCFPLNIFHGAFYFAIGKYICENREKILSRCSRIQALAGFAVFYILFAVEIFVTKHLGIFDSSNVTFSTALMAFFLFLFCLQTDISIRNGVLLRKLSTIIYCSQGNVLLVNGLCKQILKISSILSFIISCAASAVICAAVLYVQRKGQWKWSKFLT